MNNVNVIVYVMLRMLRLHCKSNGTCVQKTKSKETAEWNIVNDNPYIVTTLKKNKNANCSPLKLHLNIQAAICQFAAKLHATQRQQQDWNHYL